MPASRAILLLFAHPAYERSRANRRLLTEASALDGLTVHDLYEAYPDFGIDVEREQRLLAEHDVIVMQHPFYWYSTPALIKEWFDLVLQHGWAYGREGNALAGKRFLTATTAGGGAEAYGPDGPNRFTVRELLAPIEQTARLCGMEYLEPFIVHGTLGLDDAALAAEARRYRTRLESLHGHR